MAESAQRGLSKSVKGIIYAVVATVAFAAMTGMVHEVVKTVHAIEIAFFRNFFGFLMFIPALLRMGTAPLKTDKLGLLCLRSVCNAVSMTLFFMALAVMPIVEVTALNFTIPLFVSIGAVLLLHEKMGMRRWSGLVVGFAGALIILQPGSGVFDWGALYVLASAAIWAVAVIDIKVLARTESSMTITFYGSLFNALLMLPAALWIWVWPTPLELLWLVGIGASGTLGHLLFAQALRMADVSLVSAFDFLRMIWATIIGYAFFAEVPSLWTWVGGFVIFAAATYVTYREGRAAHAAGKAAAAAKAAEAAAE